MYSRIYNPFFDNWNGQDLVYHLIQSLDNPYLLYLHDASYLKCLPLGCFNDLLASHIKILHLAIVVIYLLFLVLFCNYPSSQSSQLD